MVFEKMSSVHPCCGFHLPHAVVLISAFKLISAGGMIFAGIIHRDYFSIVIGMIHIFNDVTSMTGAMKESFQIVRSCLFAYIPLFVLSIVSHVLLAMEVQKKLRGAIIVWAILDIVLNLYSFWVMDACVLKMRSEGGGTKPPEEGPSASNPKSPEVLPLPPAPESEVVIQDNNQSTVHT